MIISVKKIIFRTISPFFYVDLKIESDFRTAFQEFFKIERNISRLFTTQRKEEVLQTFTFNLDTTQQIGQRDGYDDSDENGDRKKSFTFSRHS